jgi:hypothetical protein
MAFLQETAAAPAGIRRRGARIAVGCAAAQARQVDFVRRTAIISGLFRRAIAAMLLDRVFRKSLCGFPPKPRQTNRLAHFQRQEDRRK